METLKKIVRNQYFPAAAVLSAVLLFWTVAMLGGLSLLHNNQPPLATLTWMLFVYMAAVLTPLAGLLAAIDLVRRWRRDRAAGVGWPAHAARKTGAGRADTAQPAASRPATPRLAAQQHATATVPRQPAPQPAAQQPGAKNDSKEPGRQHAA